TSVALGVCWLALGSQAGRVAQAGGRNPLRIASLGYRLASYRVLLALLAGGVAGLAGWISALQARVVGQDVLGLDTSLNALTYALVGGVEQPILGSAVGATLVHLANAAGSSAGRPSPLFAGLGLLLVVYVLPKGVLGLTYV